MSHGEAAGRPERENEAGRRPVVSRPAAPGPAEEVRRRATGEQEAKLIKSMKQVHRKKPAMPKIGQTGGGDDFRGRCCGS